MSYYKKRRNLAEIIIYRRLFRKYWGLGRGSGIELDNYLQEWYGIISTRISLKKFLKDFDKELQVRMVFRWNLYKVNYKKIKNNKLKDKSDKLKNERGIIFDPPIHRKRDIKNCKGNTKSLKDIICKLKELKIKLNE